MNCDGVIATGPHDEPPTDDLSCPNCGSGVKAPTKVDRFVADVDVKEAIKEAVKPSNEKDDPGSDGGPAGWAYRRAERTRFARSNAARALENAQPSAG